MRTPRSRRVAAGSAAAWLIVALVAVGMSQRAQAAPVGISRTVARTIRFDGLERTYLLHVPGGFPQGRPAGLVFVLHGGGGTGRNMEQMTQFSGLADREGFIAVYPDAVERNWNDARDAPNIRAQRENVDDVGFIGALIALLTREFGIDPRRVYSTGISNGAFMSQRLAVELSDRIAAIAPVVGGMAPRLRERTPNAPVSVLVMNGTDDPLVPYQGGTVARTRGETISVADIVRLWVTHNRCTDRPETVLLPDRDPADGTRVRRTVYGSCAGKTEVVLYTIEGGGHTWPGGPQYLPAAVVGRVSRDIDATRVIWDFFAAHPRS